MAELIVLVIYVITVGITWNAIRKNAIVTGDKPDGEDVFFVITPVINIVIAMGAISETNSRLPGKRSIAESFFGIKPDDYWKNGRGDE